MKPEDLRHEISDALYDFRDGVVDIEHSVDRILALPEIANGQAALAAYYDTLGCGSGFVRIEYVNPRDVVIDAPETAAKEPSR